MAPASVSSFLAQDAPTSIELVKLVLDPVDVVAYISKFRAVVNLDSKAEQSFAKLYHRGNAGSFDIKLKTFGTNTTSMVNEHTRTFDLDEVKTLTKTWTTPITRVPNSAEFVEIVVRTTFDLKTHEGWILQVDLVKTLNNELEFAIKLPKAKALLIEVPLAEMDASAYDYVRTFLIYVGSGLTEDQIHKVLNLFDDASKDTNENYQKEIYALSKDIFRDQVIISQFKHRSGFKRLCSNTVELSRPIYFKQVFPMIDTFYMTDKMDGTRAILVIDEMYRRSGHRRIHLGTNIKAIADQVYEINAFEQDIKSTTIETDHTVLDVEMMTDKRALTRSTASM